MITNKVAEVQVKYFPNKFISDIKITASQDAHDVFRSLWSDDIGYKEHFYVLLLNNANRVLGFNHLATGGSSAVIADVKHIMQLAIKTNAQSLILAHNHPSGNKKASKQDIELTKKVKEACRCMDIALLDHLILMPYEGEYLSMADEGLI